MAGLLESLARPTSQATHLFLVPHVRGLDFFAAAARQAEVDRWWGGSVPSSTVPVYLLCHEEGLASWLRGLDGVFMVATPKECARDYQEWMVVESVAEQAPLALAEAAIIRFGVPGDVSTPSLADVFARRDARMVTDMRLNPEPLPRTSDEGERPALLHISGVLSPTITSEVTTASSVAADNPVSDQRSTSSSPNPLAARDVLSRRRYRIRFGGRRFL